MKSFNMHQRFSSLSSLLLLLIMDCSFTEFVTLIVFPPLKGFRDYLDDKLKANLVQIKGWFSVTLELALLILFFGVLNRVQGLGSLFINWIYVILCCSNILLVYSSQKKKNYWLNFEVNCVQTLCSTSGLPGFGFTLHEFFKTWEQLWVGLSPQIPVYG